MTMLEAAAHLASRRNFLTGATATGLLLHPSWLHALRTEIDPRTRDLIAGIISVDMHNHVYPAGTEPHPHFPPPAAGQGSGPGAPGREKQARPPTPPQEEKPAPTLSAELKRSGLTAVCASYVLDFAENQRPGDAYSNLLRWFDAIDAQLQSDHILRALNLQDLQAAHTRRVPKFVQSVEGAQFLEGKLERVAEVYRRGLRHLQLLHMTDDAVVPLGDVNTGTPHLGGLTPFGAQVVKECNRLGILIDMAHASHETVLGALRATTQPLIISHTNLDTWTGSDMRMADMMKPRLISREHAKVVAQAGGIIGIWTHLANSPQEFVGSIKAMVDAIGVEAVGIGSDTDLLSLRVGGGTNVAWPGMTQGFLPVVVAEMLHQGFRPEEISSIAGGNFCRIFGKVTAGHA